MATPSDDPRRPAGDTPKRAPTSTAAAGARLGLPLPFGWFRVCESDELSRGEVRPVRYLGRDLVIARGEDGRARVFDAYCPHLGAHLGHGGRMEGDTLRCPFHHWGFDRHGACVDVPYAKRIPRGARLGAHPVCERNGIVFFWFHPHGEAPNWQPPLVPEWSDPAAQGEWSDPKVVQYRVKSHAQEMAENVVDAAHFRYVHGNPEVPPMSIAIDGHILRGHQGLTFATPDGATEGRVDVESHGGSIGVTRFSGFVETLLLITGTPIESGLHETTIRFRVRRVAGNDAATAGIARAFVDEIERQYTQDIPIWENKRHLPRPLLCDGDGPIHEVRRFFSQFYA